jgi:N-methylhydantoinase A
VSEARIGVDTGGTFTDLVRLGVDGEHLEFAKVPSRPDAPPAAIDHGLGELGSAAPELTIGTTTALNAVLQRRGPRVVLITNAGFEDVPFIGRLDKAKLYDVHWRKPAPLVRCEDCIGIEVRTDRHGRIVQDFTGAVAEGLRADLARYAEDPDVAIAVCLLFSYLNPGLERRVRDVCGAVLPRVPVSLSSEVSPVWREFERATTTVVDAFVKPAMQSYVELVIGIARERLETSRCNLLASNGGFVLADRVMRRPAQMLMSGLAGGVIGARAIANQIGVASVFTLDMGGTSCDIGLIAEGAQLYVDECTIEFGLPVTLPTVAVTTIGAGGGSIAWVDRGGLLHVGPQSAGADPGPAAYRRGGKLPTVTDADLLLGRLDPDFFLGGSMAIDVRAAAAAIVPIADQLGLSVHAAALAIVETVDENMANAIRLIGVDRGIDLRTFSLMALGGAGPLHARAVASRLGMRTVYVPRHPGVVSALGAATAQARVDHFQTFYMRSDALQLSHLAAAQDATRRLAISELERSVSVADSSIIQSAQLRYLGQNHELELVLPATAGDFDGWEQLLERFHAEHRSQYGFALDDEPVELTGLRATALRPEPNRELSYSPDSSERRRFERRAVWFRREEADDCAVLARAHLDQATATGPAVIEEHDSTVLLHPGDTLEVIKASVLQITIGAR